jgi:hypothetical protein
VAGRSERVGEESLVAFSVFLRENFVGEGERASIFCRLMDLQKVFFHNWFDLSVFSLGVRVVLKDRVKNQVK